MTQFVTTMLYCDKLRQRRTHFLHNCTLIRSYSVILSRLKIHFLVTVSFFGYKYLLFCISMKFHEIPIYRLGYLSAQQAVQLAAQRRLVAELIAAQDGDTALHVAAQLGCAR